MPSPLPRQVRWSLFARVSPSIRGLPCVTVRSAPAIVFSGPAQRLLTLWPARSPSRQATLSIESSDSFVASAAASIATGWSEPVPGRELHPLKSSAFHGALLRQLTRDVALLVFGGRRNDRRTWQLPTLSVAHRVLPIAR